MQQCVRMCACRTLSPMVPRLQQTPRFNLLMKKLSSLFGSLQGHIRHTYAVALPLKLARSLTMHPADTPRAHLAVVGPPPSLGRYSPATTLPRLRK